MAAEDFVSSPTSAKTIYDCIRSRLVDQTTPGISSPDRKLPLVYVLDSLLKNVKGVYVNIITDDASNWMPIVYDMFDKANKENEMARLKKVWNTWRNQGAIQDEAKWRLIGQCFIKKDEDEKAAADAKTAAAGIGRNADGTLQLTPSLRKQMQLLLDEVQSSGVDELDKVSLERLADINPDLLEQIKDAAMAEEQQQQQTSSTMQIQQPSTSANTEPIVESEWAKLKLNHLEKSHDLVASIQRHVRSANETTVVKSELNDTIHLFASIEASAQLLTDMLQQMKDEKVFGGEAASGGRSRRRRYSLVRKENFTNEGIKKRNDAVIAQLYEVGLPFICSADGRRFGSQLELSKHLDALFRKSQLEKTMETTAERGWYPEDSVWVKVSKDTDTAMDIDDNAGDAALVDTAADGEAPGASASLSTVIADESRDRCILCGINFAMFFDQDDGEWKYRNCIEKNVEQDGPTMDGEDLEPVLVHMTCWEGLGSPDTLTPDQIILHAN